MRGLVELANAAVVGDGLSKAPSSARCRTGCSTRRSRPTSRTPGQRQSPDGGNAPEKGYFIRPTIVRDIAEGTRLVDEEQFGPVLPVIKYSDPEDALRRANATPYGLGASVWSSNKDAAYDLASKWMPAPSGSTSTSTFRPTCPSAAPRIRESAESWAKKAWTNIPSSGDQHRRLRETTTPSI